MDNEQDRALNQIVDEVISEARLNPALILPEEIAYIREHVLKKPLGVATSGSRFGCSHYGNVLRLEFRFARWQADRRAHCVFDRMRSVSRMSPGIVGAFRRHALRRWSLGLLAPGDR